MLVSVFLFAQELTVTKNHREVFDNTLGKCRGHQCASNDTRHVDEAIQAAWELSSSSLGVTFLPIFTNLYKWSQLFNR
jgi:hypothetical protein